MRIVWRCLFALVVIWTLAAGAIVAIQWSRPTPQKFISYVIGHPLEGLQSSERVMVVDRAAQLLNGLTLEQRQEVKRSGVLKTFVTQLSVEERRRFIEATLPAGFRQMVAALNKMDHDQRQKVVERTLRDLRRQSAMADELSGEEDLRTMILQGASIFEKEASLDVKRDFVPVIEELQRREKVSAASAVPSAK